VIDKVDVADILHVNASSIARFKRQAPITDLAPVLQFRETRSGDFFVYKGADFPPFLAHKVFV